MSLEVIPPNEHTFISALTSFFNVSSSPLALFYFTVVLLFAGTGIAAVIIGVYGTFKHMTLHRTLHQVVKNDANEDGNKSKQAANVDIEARVLSSSSSCRSEVNGISEEKMMENMTAGVADAYLRLIGRKEPFILPGTPNIPKWRQYHWDSTKGPRPDCTQFLEKVCQPGCFCDINAENYRAARLERAEVNSRVWSTHPEDIVRPSAPRAVLERDTMSSKHSWTMAEAYRFINGYAATEAPGLSGVSNWTGTAGSRETLESLSQRSRYSGRFATNDSFRFPASVYSNSSGESRAFFTPSCTASDQWSVLSRSSPDVDEVVTPKLPCFYAEPRPATWPAPSPAHHTPNHLRGVNHIFPIKNHLMPYTKSPSSAETSIATSTHKYHDIEAGRWSSMLKDCENAPCSDVGIQWGAAVSADETERDNEHDISDGDIDGMCQNVFLTSVGEKLAQNGRGMSLGDITNTQRRNASPLPPVTETFRDGGAYKVKQGMKRHRQLRPTQLGY